MVRLLLIKLVFAQMALGWAQAGPLSLLQSQGAAETALLAPGEPRGGLVQAALPGTSATLKPGSLFADQAEGSLFAPRTAPQNAQTAAVAARPAYGGSHDTGIRGLKNLIAKAEAGSAQYDAVVFSARIKPPKRPTEMTLAEIYKWIRDTPRQNHAIGRYQFIPKTLRALVERGNIPLETRFSPEVQDQLAMYLLDDAGIDRFLAGNLSRRGFMNNLAKIWAGLPNSTGRSHYHGFAGNKNTISWATFEAAMKRYFPTTG